MLGSLGTASGAVAVAPEKMLPLFGNFFFDREPRQQAPRAMPHAAPFPALRIEVRGRIGGTTAVFVHFWSTNR